MRVAGCIILLLAVCGCTKYQHVIVDPPDSAQTVGRTDDVVFTTSAAEYRLRTVEDKLVVRIFNNTEAAMELSGRRSVVVASNGQSHPVPGQTIAPGSFIKLILPPPTPEYYPRSGSGVSMGFGFSSGGYPSYRGGRFGSSVGVSSRHYYGPRDNPQYYDEPIGYGVHDEGNPIFWTWPVGGQITVTLSYDLAGGQQTDRFVIRKEKAQ